MNASVEKWYPVVLGGVATGSYFALRPYVSLPPSTKELFTAIMTISSIAVGFLMTAKSILLTLNNRAVRFLKDKSKYGTLIDYMITAVNWSFLCAVVTAFLLLIDCAKPPVWLPCVFAPWVFVTVTCAASCYRVVRIFSSVLRSGD